MSIELRLMWRIGRAVAVVGAVLWAGASWTDTPAYAQAAASTDAAAQSNVAPAPQPRRKERRVEHAPISSVMQGSDTVGLIAMLPWWRADDAAPPRPESGSYESPILTACDLWLGFPYATMDAGSLTVRLAAAQHASEIELALDRVHVADPDKVNEIDLMAPDEPRPANWGWLN